MPPFTKEDAVHLATSGDGVIPGHFPQDIGKWAFTIDGYQVTRETHIKEMDNEIYLLTFTEKWRKGNERGTWESSYEIDRWGLASNSSQGTIPPYY